MLDFNVRSQSFSQVPVAPTCNPREAEIRRMAVQGQPRKIVHQTLSQKYPLLPKKKNTGAVAQVEEHLLNKCEPRNLNHSTPTKKKNLKALILLFFFLAVLGLELSLVCWALTA
jgi:hypothetical protein